MKIFKNLKLGFTLSEVLITLGIIGVVAALTIPNLMTTFAKKRTVALLKESYSIIQQAAKLSQEDNGEVESWDKSLDGHTFFKKYFANYVKWGKEYTSTELKKIAPRTLLNGRPYSGNTYNHAYSTHFSLLNGVMITMNRSSVQDDGIWIGIDVNGISKPNRIGRDTFLFFLSSKYGLRPVGDVGCPDYALYGVYDRNKIKNSSKYNACSKKYSGYWCSALIMQDGWTMAKDYPWN